MLLWMLYLILTVRYSLLGWGLPALLLACAVFIQVTINATDTSLFCANSTLQRTYVGRSNLKMDLDAQSNSKLYKIASWEHGRKNVANNTRVHTHTMNLYHIHIPGETILYVKNLLQATS